ncbi:hypothetical protein [Deinococcus marmoris]|uniref:Oligosaccharide repeat unit polymerase n=1 Tax=Deinococcus marmoris TaxID=249408 RepID=A0A1U7NSG6_9DEIO|nr:hypothetical protein [Deinococcus marmoris]OLV15847.1 hypothetical protein BOO71_0013657 [Deinococcus marmoris]
MVRLYKIIILVALGVCALLIGDGRIIFGIGFFAMLAYVAVSGKQVTQIRLDHIWALSYTILISTEGFFDAGFITRTLDVGYFDRAAQYITLINIGFLLAFNTIRPIKIYETVMIEHSIKRGYLIFLYISMTMYILLYAPVAIETVVLGRAVVLEEDLSRGLIDLIKGGVILNLGVFLPIAFAYHFYFLRDLNKHRAMLYTILVYLPVLMIQLGMGVRSPLILTALGLIVIHSSRYPGGGGRVLKLGGLGFTLIVLGITITQVRSYGLSQGATISFAYDNSERFPTSEGVVEYFSRMVQYFDFEPLRGGREHLAVALFWVPRSFWPDKPEQLEHWFYREYWGPLSLGVSDAHSIAATFAATSYADFGFMPTLMIWTMAGFLFALLNRYVMTYVYIKVGHHRIVWAAVITSLTFYAVRQINYVLFLAVGFSVIWLTYSRYITTQQQESINSRSLNHISDTPPYPADD